MENLDSTILATGLPVMAQDFGISPVSLNVGITAYLLTLAVLIPVSGWMANRFGERRTFASAVLVFTVASVFCGLSRSLPMFLTARILQGVGGSMMVPVGRLMVVRSVTKPQLMQAIAYTIWPALAAPVLGPVVGGYIIHFASWPWMFLLNAPIGVILFVLSLLLVQDSPDRDRTPLDVQGFLLVGSTCLLLVLGLERLASATSNFQWSAVGPALLIIIGSGAAAFLAKGHLQRKSHPLFSLQVLAVPTFRTVVVSGSLFRMAVFSMPFLLPLLFQIAFGMDALHSGSLTMAVFAGNIAMKPLTSPLLRLYGFRTVLLWNGVVTAGLLVVCGWLQASTPTWLVLAILFLGGVGRSLELTSLTTLGFADLPPALTASGVTVATMIQQMTVSVGIALAAVVLQFTTDRAAPHGDFRLAFTCMGLLAGLSLFGFFRLHGDDGSAVSGHRSGPVT